MHAATELLGDETGREFNPFSFRQKMLEFCAKHHRQKRALVFAFFIYDFRDAQIIKVLQDPEYWAALDHISGNAITVFACNSPTPVNPNEPWALELRSKFESILTDILGVNARFKSPSILFFQVNSEEVVESFFAALDEKKVEESFNEMREIMKLAANALKNVTEENRGNVRDVFYLVEQQLAQRRLVKTISKGIQIIKPLHGVLTSVARMFGK
jgi:hypothetical protein